MSFHISYNLNYTLIEKNSKFGHLKPQLADSLISSTGGHEVKLSSPMETFSHKHFYRSSLTNYFFNLYLSFFWKGFFSLSPICNVIYVHLKKKDSVD